MPHLVTRCVGELACVDRPCILNDFSCLYGRTLLGCLFTHHGNSWAHHHTTIIAWCLRSSTVLWATVALSFTHHCNSWAHHHTAIIVWCLRSSTSPRASVHLALWMSSSTSSRASDYPVRPLLYLSPGYVGGVNASAGLLVYVLPRCAVLHGGLLCGWYYLSSKFTKLIRLLCCGSCCTLVSAGCSGGIELGTHYVCSTGGLQFSLAVPRDGG